MGIELRIYAEDSGDFTSLRDWLAGIRGLDVTPVAQPGRAGLQGSGWDFLSVACGTGGAATVAVGALKAWIESRVTKVRVKIGPDGKEFVVSGTDVQGVMAELSALVKVLELDEP